MARLSLRAWRATGLACALLRGAAALAAAPCAAGAAPASSARPASATVRRRRRPALRALRQSAARPGSGRRPLLRHLPGHPPAYDATVAAADYAAPLDQLRAAAEIRRPPGAGALVRRSCCATPCWPRPRPAACPTCCARCRWAAAGWSSAASTRRWKSPGRWRARWACRCQPQLAARTTETRAPSRAWRRASAPTTSAAPSPWPTRPLVDGRHVGLVDDVMTSGHTLDELAATLQALRRGARDQLCSRARRPHMHCCTCDCNA